MKKIILITLCALLLLSGCATTEKYDKNEVYKVVNAFSKDVKNQNYDKARTYYVNGEDSDVLSFTSLVNSSYFGHAIAEGNFSYTIQSYNEETNSIKISFIYDNESHSMTVLHVDDEYKIFFTEEEIKK